MSAAAESVLSLGRADAKTRQASSQVEQAMSRAASGARSRVVLDIDGERVEMPGVLVDAVLRTAHELAVGHRVRLIAPDAVEELSPNQAAAYLGISRPLLVKLLDDGAIVARTLPGSRHRKIAVVDLDAFVQEKARRRGRLSAAMSRLDEAGIYVPSA